MRLVAMAAIVMVAASGAASSVWADAAAPASDPMADMPGMKMPPGMTIAGEAKMMGGIAGAYAMTRDASGTAWQPDSTPMDGASFASGAWAGMAHGYVDLVDDHQGGPRGAQETFSESMLMIMGQRAAGPGVLTLKTMLSLDPLMGKSGYPLLLQTGETANGVTPLIDRQHPHDLFMELAALYSLPVSGQSSTFIYVGYPGEPALGPPAFMHRVSGMDGPAAPISHHWLDSTHISYGVVTGGYVHGAWKIELSTFKGREPDQNRWNFDPPKLDSYSGRVSWNPTPDWSLQTSYGLIRSPEQLEPEVDQRRTTASAIYNRRFDGGNWQTTIAWGRNAYSNGPTLDAYLAESAVTWMRHTVFARAEQAQKNELFLPPNPLAGPAFNVAEFTLGYVYDIPVAKHLGVGLGVMGTTYALPAAIQPAYGGHPASYMTFVRFKII
jgi:hypothetical protein